MLPTWTLRRPTADALVEIAEEARARLRRQDPEAAVAVEERYSEVLQALDWYLDDGQRDSAFRLASGRGDEMSVAWTLNGLAAVTAAKGDLDRAARLNGMAAAMLDRAGGEWPPDEREQYDETLSTVTTGLAPDVLKRCLAEGAAMTLRDGVAYALQGSS
jgi:hypothetical protein